MSITVTVVIPCFNCSGMIEETILSVQEQINSSVIEEILVINDNSNDENTFDTLLIIEKKYKNVRVIENTGPSGPAAARNTGIRAARGNWIAFLDSDDIWPPASLQNRLAGLKDYPDAEWIGADFYVWYPEKETAKKVSGLGMIETNNVLRKKLEPAFEQNYPIELKSSYKNFIEII